VFCVKLLLAKSLHDTSYLEVSYWKGVHNCSGTSEGITLNVIGQTASVACFNYLHMEEGFFAVVGWSKTLQSKEELLIVIRRHLILIETKKRLRSTVWPPLVYRMAWKTPASLVTFRLSVHSGRVPGTMWNWKVVGGKAVSIGMWAQELPTAHVVHI
jgi:hypothetical protein